MLRCWDCKEKGVKSLCRILQCYYQARPQQVYQGLTHDGWWWWFLFPEGVLSNTGLLILREGDLNCVPTTCEAGALWNTLRKKRHPGFLLTAIRPKSQVHMTIHVVSLSVHLSQVVSATDYVQQLLHGSIKSTLDTSNSSLLS